MAIIHKTTLTPGKLDLLTAWLPAQSWYRGGDVPVLERAGGFRLDDPAGEVGIEFFVANDSSGSEPVTYLIPLTYRGAPLAGAESALIGTTEHGVLGTRYVYDGAHDPVLMSQLMAFARGEVQAQAQSVSNQLDESVTAETSHTATEVEINRVLVPYLHTGDAQGEVVANFTAPDGSTERAVFAVTH